MTVDSAGKVLLSLLVDKAFIVQVHVKKRMALPAEEMGMRLHIAVKPVRPVGGNLNDFSQFCQKRQIAVNGSQTDIRKFLPHMQIDGIGSRVIIPGHQKTLDRFPLPAVF